MDWVPLKPQSICEKNVQVEKKNLWYVKHGTKCRLWCWGPVGVGEGDEVDPEFKEKSVRAKL